MGIGLGRNPDGVVRDVAARFESVRTKPAVLVGLAVALVALVGLAEAGAIGGWWFGLLCVFAIFATPGVATLIDARTSGRTRTHEVPLEWIGIDRPFSPADLRAIDAVLALPEGAPA
jgi:hypothetical protein